MNNIRIDVFAEENIRILIEHQHVDYVNDKIVHGARFRTRNYIYSEFLPVFWRQDMEIFGKMIISKQFKQGLSFGVSKRTYNV